MPYTIQNALIAALNDKESLNTTIAANTYFEKSGPVMVVGGGPVGQVIAHRLTLAGVDSGIVSSHGHDAIVTHGVTISSPVPTQSYPKVYVSLHDTTAPDSPLSMVIVATQIGDPTRLKAAARALDGIGIRKVGMISNSELQKAEWVKLAKNLANFALLALIADGSEAKVYADILQESVSGDRVRAQLNLAVSELCEMARTRGVELDKTAMYRDVLTYAATDHLCTTMAKVQLGRPVEDLFIGMDVTSRPILNTYTQLINTHNNNLHARTLVQAVQNSEVDTRLAACLANA